MGPPAMDPRYNRVNPGLHLERKSFNDRSQFFTFSSQYMPHTWSLAITSHLSMQYCNMSVTERPLCQYVDYWATPLPFTPSYHPIEFTLDNMHSRKKHHTKDPIDLSRLVASQGEDHHHQTSLLKGNIIY